MRKKSIENVVMAGEFFGSFEKLKKLTSSRAGRWREIGIAKVFVGDDGDDIIWWPDTGDILSVYHAEPCDGARRTAECDQMRRGGHRPTGGRWKTFEHAKLGNVSLPELVFRDPWFFLEKLSRRADVSEGIDKAEIAEISEKISSIRIPGTDPLNSFVIHKFTARDYVYEGFTVTKVPIERTRQRGCAVVDDRISLCRADTGYERACWEQTPITSLSRVLEPDAVDIWDRERCEAFFDDETNFMPVSGKLAHVRTERRVYR